MKNLIVLFLIATILTVACEQNQGDAILFFDDYNQLPRGPLGSNVGAHTEYHYLHEAKPKGNWAISTFRSNLPASWFIREVNGRKVLFQEEINPNHHWHPMVVAGDVLWENYTVHTSFSSLEEDKQCGVVFRYNNDRCYYLLGVKQDSAFIKMVRHATAYHQPFETTLAIEQFDFNAGEELKVTIEVNGHHLAARFQNGPDFTVTDSTYSNGKIAFLADGPAYFYPIEISADRKDIASYERIRNETDLEEQRLIENNPKPVLWKKIETKNFGVGRNLRFGDLNNDGTVDVLVGQVMHHGHKDRNSELSCLTAMTFDGEILWQKGKPDLWRDHLTNDVSFQIHDIDNDGSGT